MSSKDLFFLQDVKCDEDDSIQQILTTAVQKLHSAITPAKVQADKKV